jgi:hypothetical protein
MYAAVNYMFRLCGPPSALRTVVGILRGNPNGVVVIILCGMTVVRQHVVLRLAVAKVLVGPAVKRRQRRHAVVVHATWKKKKG